MVKSEASYFYSALHGNHDPEVEMAGQRAGSYHFLILEHTNDR